MLYIGDPQCRSIGKCDGTLESFSLAHDRDEFWLDHATENISSGNHADQGPILPYHWQADNAIRGHLGDDSVDIVVFLNPERRWACS
jgi:hypothetical protein